MDRVLVLNAGSSSIKFSLFGVGLDKLCSGSATGIGGAPALELDGSRRSAQFHDHTGALEAVFGLLMERGVDVTTLSAVGHRVVHGGAALTKPCLLTPEVITQIEACIPLAPLHNPHNLAAIRAVSQMAPELSQCASFDTAFHATNPEVALRYALPEALSKEGCRRYGFHGISYQGLAHQIQDIAGKTPVRLLALHLGNGASLAAIKAGVSVATTMGYSPLSGLTMGTRCGDIDGNLVLRLVKERGEARAAHLLNSESGLLALGGTQDMRGLQQADHAEAKFAVEHFCYWAVRHAGSMIAAMGGLDAVAFTGGIGENDASIRDRILAGLQWLGVEVDGAANRAGEMTVSSQESRVPVWIIPAEEEKTIARDALTALRSP